MSKELVCLECTLPICDDRQKECRYVQITRRYTPVTIDRRTLPEVIKRAVDARRQNRKARTRARLAERRQRQLTEV